MVHNFYLLSFVGGEDNQGDDERIEDFIWDNWLEVVEKTNDLAQLFYSVSSSNLW